MVQQLDLVAHQYRDIDKLTGFADAPALDYEQARIDHFNHQAQRRERSRCAPYVELVIRPPYTQMDPGTLDCRREPRESLGCERNGCSEC